MADEENAMEKEKYERIRERALARISAKRGLDEQDVDPKQADTVTNFSGKNCVGDLLKWLDRQSGA
jgi:hypothetical protein